MADGVDHRNDGPFYGYLGMIVDGCCQRAKVWKALIGCKPLFLTHGWGKPNPRGEEHIDAQIRLFD